MIDALLVSNVLLWIAVVALSAVVLALVRQIGLLHERIAPVGALVTQQGPRVGEVVPELRFTGLDGSEVRIGGRDDTGTLLFFLSPSCPVCKTLLPTVLRAAGDERPPLRVVLASDGEASEHRRFVAEHDLSSVALRAVERSRRGYQVAKLPYAVLIDGDGVLRAKGLVNTREHLESLFEARASASPRSRSTSIATAPPPSATASSLRKSAPHTTGGAHDRDRSLGGIRRASDGPPRRAARLPVAARQSDRRWRRRAAAAAGGARHRRHGGDPTQRRRSRSRPAWPRGRPDEVRVLASLLDRRLSLLVLWRQPDGLPARHRDGAGVLDRHLPQPGRRPRLRDLVQRLLRPRHVRALLLQPQRGRSADLPPVPQQRHQLVLGRLEPDLPLLDGADHRPRRRSATGAMRRLALLLVVVTAVATGTATARGDERFDYVLHCAGCHKPDGSGSAAVPALDEVGRVFATPRGREYLARVPGVAQAPLASDRLAALLNWLVAELGDTAPRPPYDAAEIDALRGRPLRDPLAARAALAEDADDPKDGRDCMD
jgi:methylamine dehydrogenase accessory protein MauD